MLYMNFSLNKLFRWLLFPISIIYGVVVRFRHFLYDANFIKTTSFELPIICVGNLSVGGTGKSPMVLYLANLFAKQNVQLAIVSRGYKRKTKGIVWASTNSTAADIGDEPLMFYKQVQQHASVVVSEKRVEGVQDVLSKNKNVQSIILDDAMQHRKLNASYTLLLTQYDNLFTNDYMIPTGTLRDIQQRSSAASVIVVTKCPNNLSVLQKTEILAQMPTSSIVFFTSVHYGVFYSLFSNETSTTKPNTNVLLVTGIANPVDIQKYVRSQFNNVVSQSYSDHYTFTNNDISKWIAIFNNFTSQNSIIVTTQKDAMRMLPFKNELQHLPIFVLPISVQFLFEAQPAFDKLILQHVQSFQKFTNK
jgi:tetraacyldisaccharide 4'-kinase